jgi:phage minor structural protein
MILAYGPSETAFTTLGLGAVAPSSCIVKEEVNGIFELELVHPRDADGKHLRLVEENILTVPCHRGTQPFRIYRVETDAMGDLKVYARHIFYDLLDNFIPDTRPTNASANDAGDAILAGCLYATPFTFESTLPNTETSYFIRCNPVQAFMGSIDQSMVNRWGGEIERDGFVVRLKDRLGADNGARIAYRKNLTGLNVTADISGVATRLYPVGLKANDTVLELPEVYIDSPYVNDYAHPRVRLVDCKDVKAGSGEYPTEADALAEMRSRCATLYSNGVDTPLLSMAVSFVDWGQSAEYAGLAQLMALELGDTVLVQHDPLGISQSIRIVGIAYDALLGRHVRLTTGATKPGIEKQIIEQSEAITQIEADIINADRITTGTLDANRIAAGSITVDKLDTSEITADMITAGTLRSKSDRISFGLDSEVFRVGEHTLDIADNTLKFTSDQRDEVDDYEFKRSGGDKVNVKVDGTARTTEAFQWGDDLRAEVRDDAANEGVDFVF